MKFTRVFVHFHVYIDCTGFAFACTNNESIYDLCNTFAGGNSILTTSGSAVGKYYPGEIPLELSCKSKE